MTFRNLLTMFLLLLPSLGIGAKGEFSVTSPNGRLTINLAPGTDGRALLGVTLDGKSLLSPSPVGLTLADGTEVTASLAKGKATEKQIRETVKAQFYRQSQFTNHCNQMDIRLKGGFGIQLRAYDEGVAYRFYTTQKKAVTIKDETAQYDFGANRTAWLAYSTNDKKPMAMAFQNYYDAKPLDKAERKLAFLPATVDCGSAKVTLTEAELKSYPGMFVKPDGGKLAARFAPYPKTMGKYAWRGMTYVEQTEDFIATSKGARSYPWRILAVTEKDTDMPTNNLVYALSEPCKLADISWIKPGKVAWDWWSDWNLKGVDFVAGINTATYKYYIDFAAKYGLEYIVLDEGWYDSAKGDIMNPIADVDLPALVSYGKQRGVGIVLWAVFNVLDEHLEEACAKYAGMGVKGFKVDFLDRDDQTATEMAYRIADAAAHHHLVLDYHGYYKPTGMSRAYPNILNYEGVFGMEEARWTKLESDMPLYDVTFPYIRMMAGQVDFTPGALRNGTQKDWVANYQKPVSMGTRCHQMACYVVHDSPFTMLADTPTDYEREPEYTKAIASLPTVYDETRVIQGEMGKFIVTARRKGDAWYVGGQTNWDARTLTLPLDFLAEGKAYTATIYRDGINASHNAEDYATTTQQANRATTLTIPMAPGGGFVVFIK